MSDRSQWAKTFVSLVLSGTMIQIVFQKVPVLVSYCYCNNYHIPGVLKQDEFITLQFLRSKVQSEFH